MSHFYFSGIQQVGIGNPDASLTWCWYNKHFGFNVPVFEEEAEAGLMLPYTGGEKHQRKAILALNMNGGGGLEIWQYTQRKLLWPKEPVFPGDLGINVLKIKTRNVEEAYQYCQARGLRPLCKVQYRHQQASHFYLRDLHGNLIEITASPYWYKTKGDLFGGVEGAVMGVSNMAQSLAYYQTVLGFSRVIFEEKGELPDLKAWEKDATPNQYHRVILEREEPYQGPFSPLLGPAQIELIQSEKRPAKKIYANRFWGDPGFIHLCFDITGMAHFEKHIQNLGHHFTVDSANSFDMGEAAGRFAYLEDPDGTLLEFVETHKVPIHKKLNWYLNLQKRAPHKSLPKLMINALGLGKVKPE